MGARRFMFTRNREREMVPEGVKLDYIGREYRASPGEGYPAAHRLEQDRIVSEALRRGVRRRQSAVGSSGRSCVTG